MEKRGGKGGSHSVGFQTIEMGKPGSSMEGQRIAGGEVVGEGEGKSKEGGYDSDDV